MPAVEPVVTSFRLPAGILGPDPETIEVRCFLVPDSGGIVLVDAGVPGASDAIAGALRRIGAGWSDVTDIVLTHSHFDHVGGLAEVVMRTPEATIWAGALDIPAIPLVDGRAIGPLREGDRVRDLSVLETPGHTPGHISLLLDTASLVLVGDLVGSLDGALTFGPSQFTADAVLSGRSLERVVGLDMERLVFSHGAEVPDPNAAADKLLREA